MQLPQAVSTLSLHYFQLTLCVPGPQRPAFPNLCHIPSVCSPTHREDTLCAISSLPALSPQHQCSSPLGKPSPTYSFLDLHWSFLCHPALLLLITLHFVHLYTQPSGFPKRVLVSSCCLTRCQKHSGLQPYMSTLLQFRRSKPQVSLTELHKVKLSAGPHSFLEVPGKSLFPHLFQLLEAACIPRLMTPSSTFKAF